MLTVRMKYKSKGPKISFIQPNDKYSDKNVHVEVYFVLVPCIIQHIVYCTITIRHTLHNYILCILLRCTDIL